jgi:collagenase-like PrtC family protease
MNEEFPFKFSVPFNNDLSIIEDLKKYEDKIYEIFFPCNKTIMGSGRNWNYKNEDYDETIFKIIEKTNNTGIKSNMLFNPTCIPPQLYTKKGIKTLIEYLKPFVEAGLTSLTFTDLILTKIIKKEYPQLEIYASVNAMINSLAKVKYWENFAKIDGFTLDKEIGKNINLIKRIRENTKIKIKLLVNDYCIHDCPFRIQHMNSNSHDTRVSHIYRNTCYKLIKNKPWEFYLDSTIAPYNLKYYQGIIDIIKIGGRDYSDKKIIFDFIESYTEMKSLDYYPPLLYKKEIAENPLFEKMGLKKEPIGVFEKISKCNRDCEKCNWCKEKYFEDMNKTKNAA